MIIEIKHRWYGGVLFSGEFGSLKLALEAAIGLSANLSGANLSGADLSGADLSGADLSGADLSDADLQPIRDDFWAVLSSAPMEVPGLLSALIEGRVDGSTYTSDCACLVGTLANVRNCRYDQIEGLKPNVDRPIEVFFAAIETGDTPYTSQFSKLAVEWIEAWPPLNLVRSAMAKEVQDEAGYLFKLNWKGW